MLSFIAVKARIHCPVCSNYLPLNGLHGRTTCPECEAVVDVKGETAWWEQSDYLDGWIGLAQVAEDDAPLGGEDFGDAVILGCQRTGASCGVARPRPTR